MKNISSFIAVAALLITVACNQAPKHPETIKHTNVATVEETKLKSDTLQRVYLAYLKLKDALANSDSTLAKTAADRLSTELQTIKGCENTSNVTSALTKDDGLKAQRKKFSMLSESIIPMLKGKAIAKGKIYVEHCPMANNGEGADWLSASKEIKNPYYGKEMPDCGSVVETLTAN